LARKSRRERTGGEAERPQNRAAVNDSKGNIFILSTDVERLWRDIPARERFELLATIAEMREWRDKPSDRPIQPAALALHQWLTRTCHKGPSTIPRRIA
jgi:hypothetical protein